jgi:hypothetical protein
MRPRDLFALAYRIAQSAMSGFVDPSRSLCAKSGHSRRRGRYAKSTLKLTESWLFGHRLRRTHVNEWRGARLPVFVLFCMASKGASLEGRGDLCHSGLIGSYV